MADFVPDPSGDTDPLEWAQAITALANALQANAIKIARGVFRITPTVATTGQWGTYYRTPSDSTMDVTFPTGLFTSTPIILHSCNTSFPGRVIETESSANGTTGFRARLARTDQTATDFHWIAIGT